MGAMRKIMKTFQILVRDLKEVCEVIQEQRHGVILHSRNVNCLFCNAFNNGVSISLHLHKV
jgi:hypothetical protein